MLLINNINNNVQFTMLLLYFTLSVSIIPEIGLEYFSIEGGTGMIITESINKSSKGHTDIIDITHEVEDKIARSGLSDGIVTIFVSGSTAGITTIEFEGGLESDFKKLWERIAPDNIQYEHNARWDDGNGYSHVRASLLGPSLAVPFSNKKLLLGTWQQIVMVDFDNRPRQRNIILQMMGE